MPHYIEEKIPQAQVEIPFESGSELKPEEKERIIDQVVKQRAYLLRKDQPVLQRLECHELIVFFLKSLRDRYNQEELRQTLLYHIASASGDDGKTVFSLDDLKRFDFFGPDSIQTFFQSEFDKRKIQESETV